MPAETDDNGKATTAERQAQWRKKVEQNKQVRLTRARDRAQKRIDENRERGKIVLTVSNIARERAERACFATEGCRLVDFLRESVNAFAEMPEAISRIKKGSKDYRGMKFLDEADRALYDNLISTLEEFEKEWINGVTVDELRQLLFIPYDLTSMILFGKMMRSAGWHRYRTYTAGKDGIPATRGWAYRKASIAPTTEDYR